MPHLSDLSHGTQNRFTLIRLIAALAVLISHAWPITQGPGTVEPLQAATGKTLGTWAVMVFFALSGYLIAGSWERAPNAPRFLALRAVRLLPALWVMLAVVALGIGPFVSDLSLAAYLGSAELWRHLFLNGTMLALDPGLPGVLLDNPYPAVQGSIWTLGYEALCYAGVLTLGLLGVLTHRLWWLAALGLAVVGCLVLALPEGAAPVRVGHLASLGLPFLAGAVMWTARHRMPMGIAPFGLVVVLAWIGHGTIVGPALLAGAIAYTTLLLGLAPGPLHKIAASLPDYSYGLYLYAFPVQTLAVAFGAVSVGTNVAMAVPVTFALAALSWHLVEKPSLAGVRGRLARAADRTGAAKRKAPYAETMQPSSSI